MIQIWIKYDNWKVEIIKFVSSLNLSIYFNSEGKIKIRGRHSSFDNMINHIYTVTYGMQANTEIWVIEKQAIINVSKGKIKYFTRLFRFCISDGIV